MPLYLDYAGMVTTKNTVNQRLTSDLSGSL